MAFRGKYDATLGSLLESEFGVAGEVKEQIVKMVSNEYRDFQQLREDKQVRHTSPNQTILYHRPSVTIFELASQFHVYLPCLGDHLA